VTFVAIAAEDPFEVVAFKAVIARAMEIAGAAALNIQPVEDHRGLAVGQPVGEARVSGRE